MDLREFDLNLLVVLDTLLAEQSVSKTAKRLGLSQPATSAALGRLRVALSDPILVREGARMMPTPRAQALAKPLREILSSLEKTLIAPSRFDPKTAQRTFKVATNDYCSFAIVPLLLARICAIAPKISLEIWPLGAHPKDSLKAREVDLVMADSWTLRHCKCSQQLFTETFTCLARLEHPRIQHQLTLDRYLAEDHALVSARGVVTGSVDAVLAKRNLKRSVRMTLPHILAVPGAIASTDLVVTIADRVANRFAKDYGLQTFVPPIPLSGFSVAVACQAQMENDPAVEWLRSELVAIGKQV